MALVEGLERGEAADTFARLTAALIDSSASVLAGIGNPETALVVWQRGVTEDVSAELACLTLDEVDDVLFTSDIRVLEAALAGELEKAGYPDVPALKADIVLLARQHAMVAGDPKVRIRLEVVETDACRKFHADYVRVRTITTYIGDGTQWIEAESRGNADPPGGPAIRALGRGDVGVFKGRLWQENPTILHRSPPIGNGGGQRLVLVIDAAPETNKMPIGSNASCA